MKVILSIFSLCLLSGFLCSCYSNKIVVIDAHTLQPVPNALVLTDKHYMIMRHVRAYKTNKQGIVYLDYNPTAVYAGKSGYWLGRDDNPNVVFLVPNTENPALYTWDKKFPSLYVPYEDLPKSNPLYDEWKVFSEEQLKMRDKIQNMQQ